MLVKMIQDVRNRRDSQIEKIQIFNKDPEELKNSDEQHNN